MPLLITRYPSTYNFDTVLLQKSKDPQIMSMEVADDTSIYARLRSSLLKRSGKVTTWFLRIDMINSVYEVYIVVNN